MVFEEKSDTWIDISSFFEGVVDLIYFPDNLKEFFWMSDRDGYPHIYRYDYNGNLVNKVTSGEWTVTNIEGINTEKQLIYYTSTEVSPRTRCQLTERERKKFQTNQENIHSIFHPIHSIT